MSFFFFFFFLQDIYFKFETMFFIYFKFDTMFFLMWINFGEITLLNLLGKFTFEYYTLFEHNTDTYEILKENPN